MKNILVPTDFSEQATNAFEVAVSMAKKLNAKIHLLHCIQPLNDSGYSFTGAGGNSSDMEDIYYLKLMERVREQMAEYISNYSDVDIDDNVQVKDMYKGVMDEVKEKDIDLIVMGSEGASGMDEVIIGSNAEKIIRRSEMPVLVIKHKHEDFQVKNIVFATNGEDNTADLIFSLRKFQEAFGSTIHLLNVNTPLNFYTSRSIRKMLNEYAEKHSITNYTVNIYNERTEEDGILYFADEVDADLICMGTHGRTGLNHFFSGSIAEDVANHSFRPVLTIKLKS